MGQRQLPKFKVILPQPRPLPPCCPRASASSLRGAKRGHCALSRGALVGRGEVEGRAGSGGPPEADIRGTYGDLREKTHSSSFFLFL